MKNKLMSLFASGLATVSTHVRQMTADVWKFRTLIWFRMRSVKYFELLAVVFGLPTVMMIWIDLDDRQAERIFRAWEVVLSVPESIREDPVDYLRDRSTRRTTFEAGSSVRQAIEFLNREFSGFGCLWGVPWTSGVLTGNSRECIVPKKGREILNGLVAVGADFSQVDLRNARLSRSFLNGTILIGADLSHARISDANLMEADLRGSVLTKTRLDGANLIGADLRDAVLEETSPDHS